MKSHQATYSSAFQVNAFIRGHMTAALPSNTVTTLHSQSCLSGNNMADKIGVPMGTASLIGFQMSDIAPGFPHLVPLLSHSPIMGQKSHSFINQLFSVNGSSHNSCLEACRRGTILHRSTPACPWLWQRHTQPWPPCCPESPAAYKWHP